jgi:hypothetical protein
VHFQVAIQKKLLDALSGAPAVTFQVGADVVFK